MKITYTSIVPSLRSKTLTLLRGIDIQLFIQPTQIDLFPIPYGGSNRARIAIFSDRRTVTLYFQYNQIDLYPRTSTAIRQAVKCFNPYTGENNITFIKEQ